MGNISEKKLRKFYHIFEQVYEEPLITFGDKGENVKLTRNTATKYLKYMYGYQIIVGPQMCVRPAVNYTEYVYLMDFTYPFVTVNKVKRLQHVLHAAVAMGDWNCTVITDKPMNFPELVGFKGMVLTKKKGLVHTPKPVFSTWKNSFKNACEYIDAFTPKGAHYNEYLRSVLPWSKNEWTLYRTFKSCIRKKLMPTLGEIGIRYEHYKKWKKYLKDYCTFHTGFYPDGYEEYQHYCFLIDTHYKESVIQLFSLFPTTPFITEVGNQLLVFIAVNKPDAIRNLLCTVHDMQIKEIITNWRYAMVLSESCP
jgi:hypothetical protein